MKNAPPEKCDSRLMRQMFGAVAPRYDFITRAFSYGMDRSWKRQAVERASFPPAPVILDLACGTGDFAKLVASPLPRVLVLAVHLTAAQSAIETGCESTWEEMMRSA